VEKPNPIFNSLLIGFGFSFNHPNLEGTREEREIISILRVRVKDKLRENFIFSEIDANFGFCGLFINQINEKDLIFSSGCVRNDDGFGGF